MNHHPPKNQRFLEASYRAWLKRAARVCGFFKRATQIRLDCSYREPEEKKLITGLRVLYRRSSVATSCEEDSYRDNGDDAMHGLIHVRHLLLPVTPPGKNDSLSL
jgi:hypothetical protein